MWQTIACSWVASESDILSSPQRNGSIVSDGCWALVDESDGTIMHHLFSNGTHGSIIMGIPPTSLTQEWLTLERNCCSHVKIAKLCKTSLGKFDATMNQMATDIGSKSAVNTIHYAPSAVDSWRFNSTTPKSNNNKGWLAKHQQPLWPYEIKGLLMVSIPSTKRSVIGDHLMKSTIPGIPTEL